MLTEYQQPNITRTLIVEDEGSEKMKISFVNVDYSSSEIDLRDVLRRLLGDVRDKFIRAYDFQRQAYYPISSQECRVPISFMNNQSNALLFLKIKKLSTTSLCSTDSIASLELQDIRSDASSFKRERSKQRVIFEVIEIVKKWREIHLSKNNFRKVSLQDAAKMVGLPKKSLDDYYYQLRLGQKYDFDFRTHLFDRIGVLRTYLKNLKETSRLDKTEKHPKRLKIIDQFENLSELFAAKRVRNDLPNDFEEMHDQVPMKIEEQEYNHSEDGVMSLQDHFYNEFEYMLNDKDPFLACDFNFKKKGIESGEDDLFF